MFKLIIRIMIRKLLIYLKFFGRRKPVYLAPPLLLSVVLLWPLCWWLAELTSRALLPPDPPEKPLQHFWRNRSLKHYMDHIQVLIEPSQPPCLSLEEVLVIILVTSAPSHFDHRQAVRQTWAQYQPTYFVLGLYGDNVDEQLVDNYVEAKQYGDLIVFDFRDHYQNLTLKTALMLQWTLDHCPQAEFMFKTDDDVLVNPWTLTKVLKENQNAALIGYSKNDTSLHREKYNKWYVPRWLYREDTITKYLSGTGYLISGDYIQVIMSKANEVPLINLEDVYFTYLVAHKGLGLTLTHEKRLRPQKPWIKLSCLYLGQASTHGFEPEDMVTTWNQISSFVNPYNNTKSICDIFSSYFEGFHDFAFWF